MDPGLAMGFFFSPLFFFFGCFSFVLSSLSYASHSVLRFRRILSWCVAVAFALLQLFALSVLPTHHDEPGSTLPIYIAQLGISPSVGGYINITGNQHEHARLPGSINSRQLLSTLSLPLSHALKTATLRPFPPVPLNRSNAPLRHRIPPTPYSPTAQRRQESNSTTARRHLVTPHVLPQAKAGSHP
ncbi:hypothetical protein CDEST_00162 [Colletotrichum destructivum]|uniref:Uncharacterized protein n=1 Tax=Colletotrichum destructivum TaxID=34406 RepID=A0AAX4HWA7_9PEZI|nr:hypothetical protein CDEST_00162 [Colletotrichum destructivum]